MELKLFKINFALHSLLLLIKKRTYISHHIFIIWARENPENTEIQKNLQASRVKNRPEDKKTDFLGKKKTILGHFFRKRLLNRPKSVKTDHITHTVTPF